MCSMGKEIFGYDISVGFLVKKIIEITSPV
jgi:hypothetical protein